MKLNVKAMGLACGTLWGIAVFLITVWFLIMGYAGETLSKLGQLYLGYTVSWGGSIVGLIWGFVDGLICGIVLAWLYNYFLGKGSTAT